MFQKIKELCLKHKDILLYIIFGGLTTVVDFVVYYPLYRWLHLSGTVSNTAAWVAAVLFAYLTNKPFVFRSHDWSMKTVGPELAKFTGGRVGSFLLQTGIIFLTVDLMHLNGVVMKLLTSVLVVIINYFVSKLLVFTKK